MSLPTVTVVGTLVADPEVRFIQSGDAVASFTIAANSRKFNKDTQKYEDGDTTFLRASCWRQMAENVAETLTKGSRVIATGRLKQESWEKDGQKRSELKLDVEEIGPSLLFGASKKPKAEDPWAGSTNPSGW